MNFRSLAPLALAVAAMHAAPVTTPRGDLSAFTTAPKPTVPPTPPAERLVGLAYTTWHQNKNWDPKKNYAVPSLGYYASDDRKVIRQHATWLSEAGVDFIWIDWSNDIGYNYDPAKKRPDFDMIEGSVFTIFDEFVKMRAEGLKTPNISIFIGHPETPKAINNGSLNRKSEQVWNQFVANPLYRPLVQTYLGKPLLVDYVGTPTRFTDGVPKWDDPRFTVRFMTGFITQQPNLFDRATLVSKYGYWSWEDRGPQTYPIFAGQPEAMNIVACWRDDKGSPTPGRRDGETFVKEWERARLVGPKFALVVSFNEYVLGEQPSLEVSKDLEPTTAFGFKYLKILKNQIALFKAGK